MENKENRECNKINYSTFHTHCSWWKLKSISTVQHTVILHVYTREVYIHVGLHVHVYTHAHTPTFTNIYKIQVKVLFCLYTQALSTGVNINSLAQSLASIIGTHLAFSSRRWPVTQKNCVWGGKCNQCAYARAK